MLATPAAIPMTRPMSTHVRLIAPSRAVMPREKKAIQPMKVAHTGTSIRNALMVATRLATTDKPRIALKVSRVTEWCMAAITSLLA
ncbi:hypothetical protein D9M68_999820 [compost metagenome]